MAGMNGLEYGEKRHPQTVLIGYPHVDNSKLAIMTTCGKLMR